MGPSWWSRGLIGVQRVFPGGSGTENPPARQEPQEPQVPFWAGKIPRGGHGSPLQGSGLEDPSDRGALSTESQKAG